VTLEQNPLPFFVRLIGSFTSGLVQVQLHRKNPAYLR